MLTGTPDTKMLAHHDTSDVPHPDLQRLRERLSGLLESMAHYSPGTDHLPILDSSVDISTETISDGKYRPHQESIHGLRILRDAVRRDLDVLVMVTL